MTRFDFFFLCILIVAGILSGGCTGPGDPTRSSNLTLWEKSQTPGPYAMCSEAIQQIGAISVKTSADNRIRTINLTIAAAPGIPVDLNNTSYTISTANYSRTLHYGDKELFLNTTPDRNSTLLFQNNLSDIGFSIPEMGFTNETFGWDQRWVIAIVSPDDGSCNNVFVRSFTSPNPPEPVKNVSNPITPGLLIGINAPAATPATRGPQEKTSLFINIGPVPDACLGDTITIHGTTNLPAGETITNWISEARYKCTKCPRMNNSVDGCCGDRIPLAVTVKPGNREINTWSREVNTSSYDFSAGDYLIDVGEPSREIWNSSGFTLLNASGSSRPWIAIDPVCPHYLGETITFRGTTNLAPGGLITIRITEPVVMCAKCREGVDSVNGCCGDFNRTVVVRDGVCGNNLWSLDVNTSDHDFRADDDYWIGTFGRNNGVENSSFFTVSGISRPNLTLNLPENETGGYALRFSGQADTGNGPDEKLILTVSSDSGREASYSVPVYRNGTGYSWNFSVNKAAIVPYNFLTVNVTSATSPEIRIERTFLYNNEPAYYPYDPIGP